MDTTILPENLQELQQRVVHAEEVKRLSNQLHAAKDLDQILLDLTKGILRLFDAEDVTLYVMDPERKQIFSRVPHTTMVEEIRLPINEQSLAGFTAKYLRPLNIADAYDRAELALIHPSLTHDGSWDTSSGHRTRQVLTYPILAENKYLMGVVQLMNKKTGGRFTKKDEEAVSEIAKSMGIALYNLRKLSKRTLTKFDYRIAQNRMSQSELDAAIDEARNGAVDIETLLIDTYTDSKVNIVRYRNFIY